MSATAGVERPARRSPPAGAVDAVGRLRRHPEPADMFMRPRGNWRYSQYDDRQRPGQVQPGESSPCDGPTAATSQHHLSRRRAPAQAGATGAFPEKDVTEPNDFD